VTRSIRFAAPLARIFMQYGLTLAEINPLAKSPTAASSRSTRTGHGGEVRSQTKRWLAELGIGERRDAHGAARPTKFELRAAGDQRRDHRGVAAT